MSDQCPCCNQTYPDCLEWEDRISVDGWYWVLGQHGDVEVRWCYIDELDVPWYWKYCGPLTPPEVKE